MMEGGGEGTGRQIGGTQKMGGVSELGNVYIVMYYYVYFLV